MNEERKSKMLTFRKDEPIYIHTPVGVIALRKVRGDSRKLEIETPGFMTPFVGDKPDLKEASDFDMLVPIRDDHGRLTGVVCPGAFRLVESPEATPEPEEEYSPLEQEALT